MRKRDIKKWYSQHNMEYIPEDWGLRDPDTGEGLTGTSAADRRTNNKVHTGWFSPGYFAGGREPFSALWRARTEFEQEEIEALDEFFAPYMIQLPLAKQNLIHDYMGWRKTQTEIGEETGISQQAVSKDLRAAIRQLTRLVAEDDPDFIPAPDGRKRNQALEDEAAGRVLNAWWEKRFGFVKLVGTQTATVTDRRDPGTTE